MTLDGAGSGRRRPHQRDDPVRAKHIEVAATAAGQRSPHRRPRRAGSTRARSRLRGAGGGERAMSVGGTQRPVLCQPEVGRRQGRPCASRPRGAGTRHRDRGTGPRRRSPRARREGGAGRRRRARDGGWGTGRWRSSPRRRGPTGSRSSAFPPGRATTSLATSACPRGTSSERSTRSRIWSSAGSTWAG